MKIYLRSMILLAVALVAACWFSGCTPADPPTAPEPIAAPEPPGKSTLIRSNPIMLQSYAESYPNNALVQYYYGESLRRAGRFEEALHAYQTVLAHETLNDAARVSRAICLLALGRYVQVREALEQDIRLFPAEITFQHMLTRVLAASPDDGARDGQLAGRYLGSLVNYGVNQGLTETIAMVWAENGDFAKALSAQQNAVNMARENGGDIPPHLLENLQRYVEKKPCRKPWPDKASLYTAGSYIQGEQVDFPPGPWQAPGLDMKARLALIVSETDPMVNVYQSGKRAEILEKSLNPKDDLNAYLNQLTQYGAELLRAGRSEEALEAFLKLRTILEKGGLEMDGEKQYWLLQNIALAHLRIGEQDNCIHNHNADSCLFPLQDGGVHVKERGSKAAIPALVELLERFPEDLSARWLLNIAYMTLGQYPEQVPEKWLIQPERFQSDAPFPRYPNVSAAVGLDRDGQAGGSVMADFNNDGLLDVISSSWALDGPLIYDQNQGDGAFSDQTKAAGLEGFTSGLNLITTDYNNDGWLDLFVLRGAWLSFAGEHPNSLLRNNGDGTFTDVTEAAGILSFHPTQTATWFDYNNDGWLDVFIGNESSGPDSHPCELYRNNGDGTFTECAREVGLDHLGFVKGVTSGDMDNDGFTDLYLSCMDEPNLLFRNLGPSGSWRFENVTQQAGVAQPLSSFPTWFWDYDNDGHLDLFVSDYYSDPQAAPSDFMGELTTDQHARLYRNRGNGTFEDVTEAMGLNHVLVGMGANFGDVDDDGWLDLYIGTGDPNLATLIPNRMFRNHGADAFQDITAAGGFGHLQKGHGISFGDLDNDGDQDVHASMGGAYSGDLYRNALFENPGHGHNWLKLKLVGDQSNRAGVGARIRVVTDGPSGAREIHRTVTSGGSFGASPFRAEIGLGNQVLKEVHVHWPVTGETQTFKNLKINEAYTIKEGQSTAQPLTLRSFKIPEDKGGHQHH